MDFIPIEFVLPALVRILRTIYSNPYFINFTILLLSQIPLFILIKKFSKNRFFSVFLYLSYTASVSMFLHSMSAVRQTLAIGFFALAVYDYTSNKYNLNLRVIILLLLMCCSHISSIIVLPLFYISRITISKKVYLWTCVLACVIGTFINSFHELLIRFASAMDKSFYLLNETSNSSILVLVPFIIPFFYLLYALPKDKLQSIWVKGMFMLVIITALLYPIAQNLDRICAYFYLMTIIAIPEIFSIRYRDLNKILFYLFNITIIFYFSYKFYVIFDLLAYMEYPYVPYKTFLHNEEKYLIY